MTTTTETPLAALFVQIDQDLKSRISAAAERDGRTLRKYVERAMLAALDREREGQAAE